MLILSVEDTEGGVLPQDYTLSVKKYKKYFFANTFAKEKLLNKINY